MSKTRLTRFSGFNHDFCSHSLLFISTVLQKKKKNVFVLTNNSRTKRSSKRERTQWAAEQLWFYCFLGSGQRSHSTRVVSLVFSEFLIYKYLSLSALVLAVCKREILEASLVTNVLQMYGSYQQLKHQIEPSSILTKVHWVSSSRAQFVCSNFHVHADKKA